MSWTSKGRRPERSLRRLADGREGLEDELVELLPVLEPLLELGGLPDELRVRERLEVGLERRHVVRLLGELLEPPAFADAQEFLECSVVRHQLSRVAEAREGLCRSPRGACRGASPARSTRRSGRRRPLPAPEVDSAVGRPSISSARSPSWVDGQHQLLSLGIGRKLRDLDREPLRPPRSILRAGCRRPDTGARARLRAPWRGRRRAPSRLRYGWGRAPATTTKTHVSPAEPAVGGRDRIPLPRARNSGDPCLDPAERARVCDVAAQLSWGSMSP